MTRLVIGLNSLLFDQNRRSDRLVAALLVVAVIAGLSRSTQGLVTCLTSALLLRSRRAAVSYR
jgi:hypothetical protein